MRPVHIASAELSDYEWCARLMTSSEPWITLQRNLEACRATLTRPGSELFVAWDKSAGQPLGFILLAPYGFAAAPYIACFAVTAGARSQGVGSQLMAFAEQRYRDRGHLFLLVSSFNHSAQRFYCRLGYRQMGEIQDYLVTGQSELIFHKRLS